MSNGVSIIVCCYNSALRLPETLKHLANQNCTIPFEIIVVNNASKDDSVNIANLEWARFNNKNVDFRIVNQPIPGLSYAREKGIECSRFDIIIFCDDDNWFSENYVADIFSMFNKFEDIDVIGSDSYPNYETEPPKWFIENEINFAIGKLEVGDITDKTGAVWGAGIAFRKAKLEELKSKRFKNILSGRKGSKLSSGEDFELCFAIRAIGGKIFYTNSCFITHFMPTSRFNISNFFELRYQNGFIEEYLRVLYNKKLPSKKKLVKKILMEIFKIPKKYTIKRLIKRNRNYEEELLWKTKIGIIAGIWFTFFNYKLINDNLNNLIN